MGQRPRHGCRADHEAHAFVGPLRSGAQAAQRGTREVFFDDWVLAAVYDRDRLGAGDVVVGPAVLEEFGSTVPVHPGFTATVDRFGNVLLAREAR